MREVEKQPCALCGRPFERKRLTKHHCVPRERGGTHEHVELICSQCHGMVHATFRPISTKAATHARFS